MHTIAEYRNQFKALLPPGRLWDALRTDGNLVHALLTALAKPFAIVDKRAGDLLAEIDPRSTTELLTEWETWTGLPDICTGSLATLQQRRAALLQKLTGVGGQNRAYFIGLALALGYVVTIDEFKVFTCESACDQPIHDEAWRFTWRVNAPAETIIEFTCESPCTDPLRAWGNALLECVIGSVSPAHTNLLFGYPLPDDIDGEVLAALEYLANTALSTL
jgi:uncharacterized protein YmfQ (DUF2313 family)